MLGYGACVDTATARKPDAALGQRRARELIRARADRLDIFEQLGVLDQAVVPQSRHHQDVCLANPAIERDAIANFETPDVGMAENETVLQLVGDVGKADGHVILGGKHDLPRAEKSCSIATTIDDNHRQMMLACAQHSRSRQEVTRRPTTIGGGDVIKALLSSVEVLAKTLKMPT